MSDEIPKWAKERAAALANGSRSAERPSRENLPSDCDAFPDMHAFARYIAQHEQPLVDRATEIVGDYHRVTGEFVNSVFQNKLEHYTRWLIAEGHIPDRKHKEAEK